MVPMSRFGQANEVANVVAFLASPARFPAKRAGIGAEAIHFPITTSSPEAQAFFNQLGPVGTAALPGKRPRGLPTEMASWPTRRPAPR